MRARPTRSRGLEDVEPGRVVLLRQRGGSGLGVVLGTHRLRGNRVLVDALLPHGSVVRTKPGSVKRVFWATPPLLLPPAVRNLAAHHRGWGRDFRETMGREGGGLLERLRDLDVASLLERVIEDLAAVHWAAARESAARADRCRVEVVERDGEKRYVVQNWRRAPGAARKRLLL